jgi:hypothetical protein
LLSKNDIMPFYTLCSRGPEPEDPVPARRAEKNPPGSAIDCCLRKIPTSETNRNIPASIEKNRKPRFCKQQVSF